MRGIRRKIKDETEADRNAVRREARSLWERLRGDSWGEIFARLFLLLIVCLVLAAVPIWVPLGLSAIVLVSGLVSDARNPSPPPGSDRGLEDEEAGHSFEYIQREQPNPWAVVVRKTDEMEEE